ncbi:hypothetical protein Dip510_000724 [Elusimicrobium posterum]|uniref:C39 family peptidase n=1 Tax=Elusimicrobium posterum TaxID=3116653 RepID=UPI003C713F59
MKKITALLITAILCACSSAPRTKELFSAYTPNQTAETQTNALNFLHDENSVEYRETDHLKQITILTSKEIKPPFKFSRLTAGAMAGALDEHSSVLLEIQVIKDNIASPWMQLSYLDFAEFKSFPKQTNETGTLDTDLFTANEYATSYRYRLTLTGATQVNDVFSSVTKYGARHTNKLSKIEDPQRIYLDVPRISQFQHGGDVKSRICNPTTITMSLYFHDHDITLEEVYTKTYDAQAANYGNWLNALATANHYGLRGMLVYFDNFEQVYDQLKQGRIVIASVRFKKGELKGFPLGGSKGHLILIKGVDEKGNIIANDSAAETDLDVEIIYNKKQFANVWLKNRGGPGYIIWKE